MGRKQREKQKKQREKKKDDVFRILIKSKAFLKTLSSKSEIGRCRCVCKLWRSLLSTPEFQRDHLRNNQVTIDDYKLVVFDGKKPLSPNPFRTISLNQTLPTPSDRNSDYDHVIYIKASLDGLVCVAVSWNTETDLVLTNPLTGASKKLPSIPANLNAVSDPVGFYTDPANSNDYKIVCVPCFGKYGAFVYSHRLYSWKRIEFPVPLPLELLQWSPATLYRQCLYFEVSRGRFSVIIRFDVKTETFKEIPVPPPANPTSATFYSFAGLVVLIGCLHMYVSYNTSDVNFSVDVWRMKDDDGCDEWERVDSFPVGQHQHKHLLICSTETTDNWLAVLDHHDNSFEKMSTEEFTTHGFSFTTVITPQHRLIYVQTLVDP